MKSGSTKYMLLQESLSSEVEYGILEHEMNALQNSALSWGLASSGTTKSQWSTNATTELMPLQGKACSGGSDSLSRPAKGFWRALYGH